MPNADIPSAIAALLAAETFDGIGTETLRTLGAKIDAHLRDDAAKALVTETRRVCDALGFTGKVETIRFDTDRWENGNFISTIATTFLTSAETEAAVDREAWEDFVGGLDVIDECLTEFTGGVVAASDYVSVNLATGTATHHVS